MDQRTVVKLSATEAKMGEIKDFPGAKVGRITTIPVNGGCVSIIYEGENELTPDKALDILRQVVWKINNKAWCK